MRELIYRIGNESASMTLGEKFLGGILVTIFSMLMVFVVLVLLMYVIRLLGSALNKNPKAAGPEAKPAAGAQDQAGLQKDAEEVLAENEEEVVAAIMAAVNAIRSSQDSKIVIRQIVKNESKWAESGLSAQINSKL